MNRMDNNFVINKTRINNNQQINKSNIQKQNATKSFEEVMASINKTQVANDTKIKFSKHALTRLSQRNIVISDVEMKKIDSAIDKAGSKGIKDALILMDNKAFVVNVKNKTIITASINEQLKDNVFTKIDGAVII